MQPKTVALIHPPVEDFYYTSVRRQPLGLLYIASVLKSQYQIEFINGHSSKSETLALPEHFSYLEEFMRSDDPMFRFPFPSYRHYGKSFKWFREQIMHSRAFVFMISAMFTPYHQESKKIIAIIRELKPDAVIVAGGAHASLYPEDLLCGGADYVITGEGEAAALALVNAIASNGCIDNIPGLAYFCGGVLHRTKVLQMSSIDDLYPDRSLLKKGDTKFRDKEIIAVLSSRGCVHACAFCSGRELWKGRRARSIASVDRELSQLCRGSGNLIINFEDENLFSEYDAAVELLELLHSYHQTFGCEFTAWNGLSIENVDETIVEKMKAAGFNELNLSLVTDSKELQQHYFRPFDSEHFLSVARKAKALDMAVRAYFILGLPGQDESSVEQTIDFLSRSGSDFYPSVFYNVYDSAENWKMQRSSAFFNETAVSRRAQIYFFNVCMRKMHNDLRRNPPVKTGY